MISHLQIIKDIETIGNTTIIPNSVIKKIVKINNSYISQNDGIMGRNSFIFSVKPYWVRYMYGIITIMIKLLVLTYPIKFYIQK